MTLQMSEAVRNARVNSIEATIGASAVLKIRTGAPPANCAAGDSGTVLASMNLPASWMADAASGAAAKAGTWEDLLAEAAGDAGHFRIYDSGVTACGLQGTVTATGGGGDMTLNNINIALNQPVTITGFTVTDGNA
jgi:hypothetical protein